MLINWLAHDGLQEQVQSRKATKYSIIIVVCNVWSLQKQQRTDIFDAVKLSPDAFSVFFSFPLFIVSSVKKTNFNEPATRNRAFYSIIWKTMSQVRYVLTLTDKKIESIRCKKPYFHLTTSSVKLRSFLFILSRESAKKIELLRCILFVPATKEVRSCNDWQTKISFKNISETYTF